MTPKSVSSLDAVIDLYKPGIDVTLIDANLRLTIDDRLAKLQQLLEFADELRDAAGRPKDLDAIEGLEIIRQRTEKFE